MSQRSIIVHFHFFKNAGTSVETILRKNFKKNFMTYEPGGPAETFPASALQPVLEKHPEVQAISSHTISFPPPEHPGWLVFPLVFIRHPLDRILSMYNYEKSQDSESPGAIIAREHGPAGYITERTKSPGERTLRNYQAWMLAQNLAAASDSEAIASAAVDVIKNLPAVGVVDEFDRSIQRLSDWLAPHFPRLKMQAVHQNRSSRPGVDMQQRIDRLKETIGDELFRQIEEENEVDLELYRLARQKLL